MVKKGCLKSRRGFEMVLPPQLPLIKGGFLAPSPAWCVSLSTGRVTKACGEPEQCKAKRCLVQAMGREPPRGCIRCLVRFTVGEPEQYKAKRFIRGGLGWGRGLRCPSNKRSKPNQPELLETHHTNPQVLLILAPAFHSPKH